MDVYIYNFPAVRDGVEKIEAAYVELLSKYRNGEVLPPEAIDWMDFANNYLMTETV